MALPELLEALERDARVEREELLASAREEAQRVLERGLAERERRRRDELASLRAELDAAAAERLACARQDGRRRVLQARAELIERVLAEAEELLRDPAVEPRCANALPTLLEEAIAHAEPGPLVVRCPSTWKARVLELLGSTREATVQPDATLCTGVVVHSASGRHEVDATALALLRAQRRLLAVQVAEHLRRETGIDIGAFVGEARHGSGASA